MGYGDFLANRHPVIPLRVRSCILHIFRMTPNDVPDPSTKSSLFACVPNGIAELLRRKRATDIKSCPNVFDHLVFVIGGPANRMPNAGFMIADRLGLNSVNDRLVDIQQPSDLGEAQLSV
jgi:hypothetical protein